METEVDIFSENPRSFKMDRKSKLASQLKSSISHKLIQFIGNHIDDVLAEYIVVLVCNGKNQHQARDDLEAFLGERSGEFVSWLWAILFRPVQQPHVPSDLLNLKDVVARSACGDDVDDEHRVFKLKELQNHWNGNAVSAEVNHHDISKHDFSKGKGSPGISSADEASMHYVEHKKIVNNDSSELLHRRQSSPKRELDSRNTQPVARENAHLRLLSVNKVAGRRVSLNAIDPVSTQNSRRRGTVWDRLGKPCEDNPTGRSKEIEVRGTDIIRRTAAHNDRHILSLGKVPGVNNSCEVVIPEAVHDKHRQSLNTTCSPNVANNSYRKRQFGEIGSGAANGLISFADGNNRHLQLKETSEEFVRLSSVLCSRSKRLNNGVSDLRKSDSEFKYPDVLVNTRVNAVPQMKLTRMTAETPPNQTLFPVNSHLVAKSRSIDNEEDVNTTLKSAESEVADVKLKLHQIEMKMSEIRSKQVKMIKDGQINSLPTTGPLNHREEDNDSRTVFVTNVHFAATKEALSLHFGKCGVVVKVIILSDTLTGQPKGSAYITFVNKESTEKAVALSGSSFWSRTLKVMRKEEMLGVVTPTPLQIAGKPPSQAWFLQKQINNKEANNLQRPYQSSHLQWRRDVNNGKNLCVSNSRQKGGASCSGIVVEQDFIDSSTGGASQMATRSLTYVRTTQAQSQGSTTKTSTTA